MTCPVPKVSRNIRPTIQRPKPEREERAGKLSSRRGRFWYCPIILLLGVLGHGTVSSKHRISRAVAGLLNFTTGPRATISTSRGLWLTRG